MSEQQRKRLTLQAFKDALKAGESPDCVIAKGASFAVKAVDGDPDMRMFRASDATIDRDTDSVNPDGWRLENFAKAGSFLWAHDARLPPIGTPKAAYVSDGALWVHVKFPAADMPHPMGLGFGRAVMRMYDEDLLRGVSVGFIPLKWAYNEERGSFAVDFQEQELLELSATPVPSNPNALHIARSKGIDVSPIVNWWEEFLKDAGDGDMIEKGLLWVPKSPIKEALDNEPTRATLDLGAAFKAAEEAEAREVARVADFLKHVAKRGLLSDENKAKLDEAIDMVRSKPEAPEEKTAPDADADADELDWSDFEIEDEPEDVIKLTQAELKELTQRIAGETVAQLTGRLAR